MIVWEVHAENRLETQLQWIFAPVLGEETQRTDIPIAFKEPLFGGPKSTADF